MNVTYPVACVVTQRLLLRLLRASTTNRPFFSSMTTGATKVASGCRSKLNCVRNCVYPAKMATNTVLDCAVVVILCVKTMPARPFSLTRRLVTRRVLGWRNVPSITRVYVHRMRLVTTAVMQPVDDVGLQWWLLTNKAFHD